MNTKEAKDIVNHYYNVVEENSQFLSNDSILKRSLTHQEGILALSEILKNKNQDEIEEVKEDMQYLLKHDFNCNEFQIKNIMSNIENQLKK